MTNAHYISDEIPQLKLTGKRAKQPRRRRIPVIGFSFVAVLALVFAIGVAVVAPNQGRQADAGFPGFFCNNIGYGMSATSSWDGVFGGSNLAPNQTLLTAQQAFSNSLHFFAYQGEGNDSAFGVTSQDDGTSGSAKTKYIPQGETDPIPFYKNFADNTAKIGSGPATIQGTLASTRNFTNCIGGNLSIPISNAFLSGASLVTNFSSTVANLAFDNNLICQSADSTGNCFNLLKIVGGSQAHYVGDGGGTSGGGIIGSLTSSIYFPLLVLTCLAVAAWVIWTGIIQRQLRSALFGLAWCLFALIFGAAFLLNPGQLAEAPQNVSNALGSCVLGALSGQNCVSSGTTVKNQNPGNDICYLNPASNLRDEMDVAVATFDCQAWKSFVVEPWAQGEFGTSYEGLTTVSGDDNNASATLETDLSKEGVNTAANDFCVNLATTESPADESASTLTLSGRGSTSTLSPHNNTECNVGLYSMLLMTDAKAGSSGAGVPLLSQSSDGMASGLNLNWYNVVGASLDDNTLYGNFAESSTNGSKISEGLLALLTSLMACPVICVTAIFAIMYQLLAAIMIGMAPIFFLIGIHPGRGRRILKGFGELVLSNILKFFVCSLYLVIVIALYGGILGSVTNPVTTFLFCLVLSLALFLYRREIVQLLGRVDMGGEKMTNFATKISNSRVGHMAARTGNVARNAAVAGVGGAIGAKMAGGDVAEGFTTQVKRDLRQEAFRDPKSMVAATGLAFESERNRQRAEAVNAPQREKAEAVLDQQLADNEVNEATREVQAVNDNRRAADAEVADLSADVAEKEALALTAEDLALAIDNDLMARLEEHYAPVDGEQAEAYAHHMELTAELNTIDNRLKGNLEEDEREALELRRAGVVQERDAVRATIADEDFAAYESRKPLAHGAEFASMLKNQYRLEAVEARLADPNLDAEERQGLVAERSALAAKQANLRTRIPDADMGRLVADYESLRSHVPTEDEKAYGEYVATDAELKAIDSRLAESIEDDERNELQEKRADLAQLITERRAAISDDAFSSLEAHRPEFVVQTSNGPESIFAAQEQAHQAKVDARKAHAEAVDAHNGKVAEVKRLDERALAAIQSHDEKVERKNEAAKTADYAAARARAHAAVNATVPDPNNVTKAQKELLAEKYEQATESMYKETLARNDEARKRHIENEVIRQETRGRKIESFQKDEQARIRAAVKSRVDEEFSKKPAGTKHHPYIKGRHDERQAPAPVTKPKANLALEPSFGQLDVSKFTNARKPNGGQGLPTNRPEAD